MFNIQARPTRSPIQCKRMKRHLFYNAFIVSCRKWHYHRHRRRFRQSKNDVKL